MSNTVFNLHLGDSFIHKVFSSQMEGIRKMINFLIRQQTSINIHFKWRRRPKQSPIFSIMTIFKSILIQQTTDQSNFPSTKSIKISNLIPRSNLCCPCIFTLLHIILFITFIIVILFLILNFLFYCLTIKILII